MAILSKILIFPQKDFKMVRTEWRALHQSGVGVPVRIPFSFFFYALHLLKLGT